MPFRPGERLRDYDVQALLGRGAHGEVLKVRGPEGEFYALKILPCDGRLLGAAQRDAAFEEARLLQRLRHPHIVGFHEVFWDQELQVVQLALEFMDGGDLQSMIQLRQQDGNPFEAHFARRILAAVGGALQYIHSAGVLHRDVKPANVLLARHSHRVKLADFGIAKFLEGATVHAQTVVGTPYYFSPEIVAGKAYGEAADSWALGVCIYEISALRRPFEAANQLALVRRIAEETYPELPEHVAHDIARAVVGLLRKDPQTRMSLAEALDVSEAVAALVAQAPVSDEVSPSSTNHLGGKLEVPRAEDEELRCSASSWRAVGGPAVVQAREALSGEVDDPEELVQALAALEDERREASRGLQSAQSGSSSGALDALESELRIRIDALRVDCAAMLDDLLLTHSSAEADAGAGLDAFDAIAVLDNPQAQESHAAPEDEGAEQLDHSAEADSDEHPMSRQTSNGSCGVPDSCCGAAASAFEEALEVATTLGVATEASEECVARKRGMLSLRVVWAGVARFCMLPMNVGFDSLVAEISRRFGLAKKDDLPELSWREAEETFKLTSQSNWEECLQRRGLVAQPGRLELCVNSDVPPPVLARRPAAQARAALIAARRAAEEANNTPTARPGLFSWRAPNSGQRLPKRLHSGRHQVLQGMLSRCPSRGLDAAAAAAEARYAAAVTIAEARHEAQELELLEESADGDHGRPRVASSTMRSFGETAAPMRADTRTASERNERPPPLVGIGSSQSSTSASAFRTQQGRTNRRVVAGFGFRAGEPASPAGLSSKDPHGFTGGSGSSGGYLFQVNGKALPRQ